ncbi:MAG: response regulator transcription factor [Chloroflexi bacterium]|jgi:two-component system, NarL family, response regulator YdfI|nr:response regulator transcription factor [Chloroflexota bacterium]MBT3670101.1 response regulator transcription factor [Chloroflexota bacterium]MBT4001733.1 response regulator transcription factor [Chloroflexota bacterium]MBT4306697.1 response regulator transcription factor [Chloroflexota bacterium]MBT4532987.1 response regulator transcription factor [Chloroflexota bacterium]
MPDPIRILIVDDHAIVREGLRLIFETVEDIEVVGEAADGAEGLALVDSLNPDVVLMDLRMPGMDGLTAIQHLHKDHPNLAVIILSTYNEDEMMLKGLKAGARGYLLKDTEREPLFNTIRAAARGETLLSPEIMGRVISQAGKVSQLKNSSEDISLTEREMEVLTGVSEGKTSKEIAYTLGITERTIKAHLTSIYQKLGVDSRAAAIAESAKRGWL